MKKIGYLVTVFVVTSSIINAQFDFFEKKATIGGYGELHYNYKNDEISSSNKLDFHRFVLFFGYSFSEKWSFKSEVEIEHNYVHEGEGELSLEQAYIDYHFKDYLGFQAGVLLASVGLINEYHEPTNFLSVERPNYSKYIIPTTWFGNGVSVYGSHLGFEYKLNILEGLNSDKFSTSGGIRGGRQKGYKSDATSLLYNAKLDFLGLNGLRIGTSFTYNDAVGDTSNIPFTLVEIHAKYRKNGFILTGEYGNISYQESDLQTSNGFYIDFGYDLSSLLNFDWQTIPFVRYTDYNTASSVDNGGDITLANHNIAWMIGLSVLPIDNTVLKADYSQNSIKLDDKTTEYFNLGIGYRF